VFVLKSSLFFMKNSWAGLRGWIHHQAFNIDVRWARHAIDYIIGNVVGT
jgi:hypothetical protein